MKIRKRLFAAIAIALFGSVVFADAAWAPLALPNLGGLKLGSPGPK